MSGLKQLGHQRVALASLQMEHLLAVLHIYLFWKVPRFLLNRNNSPHGGYLVHNIPLQWPTAWYSFLLSSILSDKCSMKCNSHVADPFIFISHATNNVYTAGLLHSVCWRYSLRFKCEVLTKKTTVLRWVKLLLLHRSHTPSEPRFRKQEETR